MEQSETVSLLYIKILIGRAKWAAPSLRPGHALLAGALLVCRASPGHRRPEPRGAARPATVPAVSPPMRVTVVAAQLRPASRVPERFGTDVPTRNGETQRVPVSVCARDRGGCNPAAHGVPAGAQLFRYPCATQSTFW